MILKKILLVLPFALINDNQCEFASRSFQMDLAFSEDQKLNSIVPTRLTHDLNLDIKVKTSKGIKMVRIFNMRGKYQTGKIHK